MINHDFFNALEEFCEERDLEKAQILDAIEKGIVNAYKKELKIEDKLKLNAKVSFNEEKGEIFIYRYYDVVTEEEIELMIKEGREDGTIEKEEEDIIKRVFKLDDQKVESIMTPRNEIIWIDLEDDRDVNKVKIIESKRSIFPIAKGELDDFIGVVQAKDILSAMFTDDKFDVHKIVKEPLVVSEHLETLELLKEFKENQEYVHMSLVVDEFGSVEGLITLNDLLEGIVGDIPGIDEEDEPQAIQRNDGTWLIDGRYPIDKFKKLFDFNEPLPDEEEDNYTTLAGFILSISGTIPDEEDKYECGRFIFEIIDIDGHQIDKVLVTDLGPQEPMPEE